MRWVKLLLGLLIIYGAYAYRQYLIEGLIYSLNLKYYLVLVGIVAALRLLVASEANKIILENLGVETGRKLMVKYQLVGMASAFSMIKFSNSFGIYYLKRKGYLLSQLVVAYLVKLIGDLTSFGIAASLVLGKHHYSGFVALVIVMAGSYVLTRKQDLLPDRWVFHRIKDYADLLRRVDAALMGKVVGLNFVVYGLDILMWWILLGLGWESLIVIEVLGLLLVNGSPTPGGLGVYEVALPAYLAKLGLGVEVAVGSALVFRFFNLWLPALVGAAVIHREL